MQSTVRISQKERIRSKRLRFERVLLAVQIAAEMARCTAVQRDTAEGKKHISFDNKEQGMRN
jgi:hypothetical protein